MLCEYLKCLLDTLYYIGVIGITLNRGALQRWILGQSERSAITRECMKMAGADPADRKLMLFSLHCSCISGYILVYKNYYQLKSFLLLCN